MTKKSIAYLGSRTRDGTLHVTVVANGRENPLPHHVHHSPTGFECGYGGSGPADLALSILIHHTGDEAIANRHYQNFKWAIIADLPQRSGWELTGAQIDGWLAAQEPHNFCPDCEWDWGTSCPATDECPSCGNPTVLVTAFALAQEAT